MAYCIVAVYEKFRFNHILKINNLFRNILNIISRWLFLQSMTYLLFQENTKFFFLILYFHSKHFTLINAQFINCYIIHYYMNLHSLLWQTFCSWLLPVISWNGKNIITNKFKLLLNFISQGTTIYTKKCTQTRLLFAAGIKLWKQLTLLSRSNF